MKKLDYIVLKFTFTCGFFVTVRVMRHEIVCVEWGEIIFTKTHNSSICS